MKKKSQTKDGEKRMMPHIIKAKEVDRENFRIYFIFSTGSVDRHEEIVDQSGWKLERYNENPIVLWGHDQSKFPIGKAEELGVIDGKLQGWVKFAYKENPEAAIAFELCAGEFLNAGSVGFRNLKWMYDEETDVLTLLENELYEFSIVNVPANPEALSKAIEDMKEKNIDKRVIDGIEDIRKNLERSNDERFKNLGSKVEKQEVETLEEEKPDEEVEVETATESTEDEVKSAMEVLLKAGPTKVKIAVESLTDVLKDANTKAEVEKTPVAQDRKNRKVYSINEVNRIIRSLISASK